MNARRPSSLKTLTALIVFAFLVFAVPAHATESTAKAKFKNPVITEFGWDRYNLSDATPYVGCTDWAAVIRNPNKKVFMNVVTLRITARDENGRILGTEEVVPTLGLPPGRFVAWSDSLCMQGEKPPATMKLTVIPLERNNFIPTKARPRAFKPFPATNVGWFPTLDDWGSPAVEMSGEVTNLFAKPQDVTVTVILRDGAGNIIGAGDEGLEGLRRNDPTPFFMEKDWTWLDGTPVEATTYVDPSGRPNPYEKVARSR